jgi:hypothetical protein
MSPLFPPSVVDEMAFIETCQKKIELLVWTCNYMKTHHEGVDGEEYYIIGRSNAYSSHWLTWWSVLSNFRVNQLKKEKKSHL